ncbi:hypothetical protein DOTSEDRAFT_70762 [Dothistroma septosporum NZE10]|uniref:Uncharacterized protein n=1 Tax=Dothistroma septosporum (strain NZE10 / CBS 128990) TaxID=675120 RepID=N1PU63_DOTSN|nr:hypothetical protein DOTSEDRAFT_70762 [Dothistroma septosporum NZE10]
MPERTSTMSWLSPRRRRTTGNLKNIPNGQYKPALDNAAGLIIPTRLERTGEEPLSIARRLSESHEIGSSNGRGGLAVGEYSEVGERMTGVEEQEQGTIKSSTDGRSSGSFDGHRLEEQLEHITSLLQTLNSRLEQIHNTIEEGNQNTAPLHKHLEGLDSAARANVEALQQLLESQQSTRQAVVHGAQQIDLQHFAHYLSSLQESSITQTGYLHGLVEAQNATREAVEANSGEIDVSPLVEQMEGVKEAIEQQQSPLLEHLKAIRTAAERNAVEIAGLVAIQKRQIETPSTNVDLDLTPMTDRLNKIHAALEKNHHANGEKSPSAGDPKFILSALTSHLSKIQAVTEHNAKSIQSIQANQSPIEDVQTKMQTSITSTSDAIRSLATTNIETHRLLAKRSNDVEDKAKENMKNLEKRMEATNSQVRELMTGQREMTKVMRDLANAISAQNKGKCDHVVIPPPRKMGKKVVGFVYDGKVVESPEGSILRR